MVQPLLVELIGEPESGKTHTSLLFPKPALIDTTSKREARPIAVKLYKEEWKKRYFPVETWEELIARIKEAVEREDVKTLIIDTSMDLQHLAAKAWMKEEGKKAVFPITQYAHVRDKVDEIIEIITGKEKHLVFTAGMKDEWVADKSTGRRIRDGYRRTPFQADIRLYLQLQEVWQCPECKNTLRLPVGQSGLRCLKCARDMALIEVTRIATVIKNRFIDKASKEWIPILKEISYTAIMEATKLPKEEWIT